MESGALLTKSGRPFKLSSIDTAKGQLRRFKAEFGDRPLASVTRHEAVRWAEKHERKQSALQSVGTLFSLAVDEELLDRSPFRGLMRKPEGRKNERPPSEEEMLLLVASCDALGDYAPRMEAMLTFAAYMIMRPGELMALIWDDIDLEAGEVHVSKRLYRGRTDLPKSNEARTVALTPPARRALLTLPERHGLVFRNKSGGQLCAPTLTGYWGKVLARAGADFDFYLATKHYGCWFMKTQLGLSNADIAAQAGWSESSVERMVATYAHANVGALDRIKAAWSEERVPA
jgi:integrase